MDYGVVTICLDAAATIARTIRSVLAQDPLPAAYLFVDGGSTDDTVGIIRRTLADAPSALHWEILEQADATGISGAWNQGIRALETELVCVLNSDDWYLPATMRTVLAEFATEPAAQIVYGSLEWRRGPEDPAPVRLDPKPLWLFPVLMPIPHPACFVRRSVYTEQGLYDPGHRLSADYEWLYRCYRAGVRFRRCREVLTCMQPGGEALSSRARARNETLRAGRRHCPVPGLPELAWFARKVTGR